jgi:hypothetical protein
MMKKTLLVFISCTVGALLIELIGGVLIFIETEQLYWFRSLPEMVSARPEQVAKPAKMLHPYFGFTMRPGLPLIDNLAPNRIRRMHGKPGEPRWIHVNANNHGFWASHDVPYLPENPNSFIVGVFGGSVAKWFALQGTERLVSRLKGLPAMADRDIIVLNFANGGFKQPQQLLTLGYFLSVGQHFDLVINIDRFNEGMVSMTNNLSVHTAMPNQPDIVGMQNYLFNQGRESAEKDLTIRSRLRKLHAFLERNRSSIAYFALGAAIQHYKGEVAELDLRIAEQAKGIDYIISLIEADGLSAPERIDQAVEIRFQASRGMLALSKAFDFRYLHVLQPNQYYSDRAFSEKEREIAFGEGPTYDKLKDLVPQFYPVLVGRGKQLGKHGIQFVDASKVLDSEPKIVYSDNCCHFNDLGNAILADHIFSHLAQEGGRSSAGKSLFSRE